MYITKVLHNQWGCTSSPLPEDIWQHPETFGGFLVAQPERIHLPMLQMRVQSLGREDHLEEEMATHSSIPAWRSPRPEEPGMLQFMGSQRAGHNRATERHKRETLLVPDVPGRLLLTSPGGCWGWWGHGCSEALCCAQVSFRDGEGGRGPDGHSDEISETLVWVKAWHGIQGAKPREKFRSQMTYLLLFCCLCWCFLSLTL